MSTNGNGTGNGHYCPLDLVENYLRRFVIYPSEHALTAHVLWIGHTHLMDCWDTSPRINFSSAEKESGKTKALEMTRLFVPSPDLFFDPSPAVIVRLVSQGHDPDTDDAVPTLLLDEIDNVFKKGVADPNNATLLGVLNQGYMPGATVPRCVGQNAQFQVKRMQCYCAIAFAGLGRLPDTLGSRTIQIRMKRRAKDERKEKFKRKRHTPEAEPIFEALAEWAIAVAPRLSDYDPEMPEWIEEYDRMDDCWETLFAVADMAGNDWPVRARAAAKYLIEAAKDKVITSGVLLLEHIFEEFKLADAIHTKTLIDRLKNREESPWMDMGKGKPLTDRTLADMLSEFEIKSRQVKISGTNLQGYRRADFMDAWRRYTPHLLVAPTNPTNPTNLSNKNNSVGAVGAVGPTGEGEDDFEPGVFEPDFDERRLQ